MLRKLLAISGFVILSIWMNVPAHASATIDIEQVGPDVVATMTGSINREGLTFSYAYQYNQVGLIAGADNFDGLVGIGESATVAVYYYAAEHHDISTSPLYFHATSSTGAHFQIREVNYSDQASLYVPYYYVSNDPINSTSTWTGNTIANMGLIPGTYLYNLGNGDTITLNIAQGPAPTYSVGGTVSGLNGTGLVLQNNGADDLPVAADGPFTFATELADAASYAVSVSTQPTGQTCDITNGSGTIAAADVTNVAVTCVDDVVPTYSVGGTVSGLNGTGLVLRNNGADDLPVAADGPFTFATELADTASYAVSVSTQPTGQTCDITNGSGTIAAADVTNVTVTCVDDVVPTYSVGGTVSGLNGTGLVLRNNGVDDLLVAADGSFTFVTGLVLGASYAVTVSTQPTGQTCSVTNGSGTITTENVINVAVTCVDDVLPPAPPPAPAAPIPAMSPWALMLLSVLLSLMVLAGRKRFFQY